VPTQSATFGLDVSAPQTTTEVILDLTSSNPPLVPGVVQPGTYTVGLQDAATMAVVGTIDLVAEGPSGQTFYGNDAPSGGPRVGWDGSMGSWLADLSSAIVNGAAWVFDTWEFCIVNSSVDGSNPVVFEELDDADMAVATTNVTSLTPCQNVTLNKATKKVRKKKSGKGKFADARGFRGKGKKKAP
jgi:hypothetical protein